MALMLSRSLHSARSQPHLSGDYYGSFNRRAAVVLHILLYAYPVIFLAVALFQVISITMAAIHLGMYVAVLLFVRVARTSDMITLFLVTHSFWMYSFTLFAYALVHWKSPQLDLYAPLLSSLVPAVALAASIVGYYLMRGAVLLFGLPKRRKHPGRRELSRVGTFIVLTAIPFVLLKFVVPDSSFIDAIGAMFQPVIWLGLICYFAGQGPKALWSPLVIGVILLCLLISLGLNGRGIIFSLLLALATVYAGVAKHAIRPGRLFIVYVVFNAVNAFSTLILSVRFIGDRENSGGQILQKILSSDFALAMLGFDTFGSQAELVNDQLRRHDSYLLYMFDGRLGVFERLTQLPHMDIVVGHLPKAMGVNWSEISNAIFSALPSVGQSKDLIFNDRLVWDLNLSVAGNVGHPLVTAAGEFYAMGGFTVLALLFGAMIAVTLYLYELARRIFGDPFIAAASFVCASIYMVFSSTSTSALFVPLRILPTMLILYSLCHAATRSLAASRRRAKPKLVVAR